MFDFDDTLYNFTYALKMSLFNMVRYGHISKSDTISFFMDIKNYNITTFKNINAEEVQNGNFIVNNAFLLCAFDYYNIFCTIAKKYTNYIITENEFNNCFLEHCSLSDGTKEILLYLRERGIKTVIISDGLLRDKVKVLNYLRIYELFDSIITSEEALSLKPSEKYFELVRQKYEFNNCDYLYIGNHISDYIFAQRCNIEFRLYNPDDSFANIKKTADIKNINALMEIIPLIETSEML